MELGVSHVQSLSSSTRIVDNIFDKYNKNLVPIRSLSDHDSNKKGHFKPLCRSHQRSQSGSRWKGSQSRSRKDQRDQTDDSSWYTYEQDSIQIVYNKGIHGNIS